MNEADHKARLVKQINSAGGWAERWEDKYRPGILDLVLKLPQRPIVFAEGKMIHGRLFFPTELQWLKGQRMIDAGITVLMIGWKNNTHEMYISPWAEKVHIDDCSGHSWLEKSYFQIMDEYLVWLENLPYAPDLNIAGEEIQ
jgi:hypothetical protein